MAAEFPNTRPNTPLLDLINDPADLRALDTDQLSQLAEELRQFMLFSVSQTGGHLGAGLGVVELTIALHRLLNTPEDKIIWDVGHQSYPHKILTGRREQMLQMRQSKGLAPFPSIFESPYDAFGTGHSSTSISAALGMAVSSRLLNQGQKAVAVIGDGALTAGMAFEALNHAAHTGADLLVILNDNTMSISPNQGGLATYLAQNLRTRVPTNPVMPLFEALNFQYEGPVDGNDFAVLLPTLEQVLSRPGPQFLHLCTQKGKGFAPAEADPVRYHAVAKISPVKAPKSSAPTFSNIFGRWLVRQAEQDSRIVGITPAMREGSDLIEFSERFPERYFDVAIAEQHAATLAAGLAISGSKPVLAIYSTFLQRAYDQLIHDIALQNLDLLIAIDRAGLVGEDGASHAGLYDIAYLRCIPNLVIMTPADYSEQQAMLSFGMNQPGPVAVRYPRGRAAAEQIATTDSVAIELGKGRVLRRGKCVAILNFGPLLSDALAVADELDLTLVDMRFVKPLDTDLLAEICAEHEVLVTIEDHAIAGGAGSAVAEWIVAESPRTRLKILGVSDRWVAHATRAEQLAAEGLDRAGILKACLESRHLR